MFVLGLETTSHVCVLACVPAMFRQAPSPRGVLVQLKGERGSARAAFSAAFSFSGMPRTYVLATVQATAVV